MKVEGREKLGDVAARLLDEFDAFDPDEVDGNEQDGRVVEVWVEEVLTIVEMSARYENGEEYCQVRIKGSHTSPVYKRGLLEAGKEVLRMDAD